MSIAKVGDFIKITGNTEIQNRNNSPETIWEKEQTGNVFRVIQADGGNLVYTKERPPNSKQENYPWLPQEYEIYDIKKEKEKDMANQERKTQLPQVVVEVRETMAYVKGLGKNIMSHYRECSREVSEMLDNEQASDVMLKRLNKILNAVDHEELKLIIKTAPTKGWQSILSGLKKNAEKIITKYVNISEQIGGLYADIESEIFNISNKQNKLATLQARLTEIANGLEVEIADGKATIESWNPEDDMEAYLHLSQKLNDLIDTKLVLDNNAGKINLILQNNYMLKMEMDSVYENTMPTLQQEISLLREIKRQSDLQETLDAFKTTKNKLVTQSVGEVLSVSQQIREACKTRQQESLKAIQGAVLQLETGMEKIKNLQISQMEAQTKLLEASDE